MLADALADDPRGGELMAWQRISPTAVARVALARGLDALEADLRRKTGKGKG